MSKKRCFILGGGPSLDDCDLSNLEGETVIACNETVLRGRCDHLIWLDPDFYKRFKNIIDDAPFKKYCRRDITTSDYPTDIIPIKTSGEYHGKDGLAKGLCAHGRTDGILCGPAAISLAAALGFEKIFLLGYDGGDINGRLHFTGYTSKEKDVYSSRYQAYERIAAAGELDIVNCSMNSKILQFKKMRYDDVVNSL